MFFIYQPQKTNKSYCLAMQANEFYREKGIDSLNQNQTQIEWKFYFCG